MAAPFAIRKLHIREPRCLSDKQRTRGVRADGGGGYLVGKLVVLRVHPRVVQRLRMGARFHFLSQTNLL